MLRSHTCGELRTEHAGEEVTLCGWVDRTRDIGQVFFLTLRDRYGITQCTWETGLNEENIQGQLKDLHLEDCILVHGKVRERREKDISKEYPTGTIDISIANIEVLNTSKPELPFQVKDDQQVGQDARLKYRYLDLRRPKMQRNLQMRHDVIQIVRTELAAQGFLEIETPLLVRSTPEGARDFVVPSRLHPGSFYALPQSPQLYKQMLMVSGCDRYFQFASAFRDEDLRADRVPVHTQIDMEMSFVEEKDVFAAVERYVRKIFFELKQVELPENITVMTYAEAMERYGNDKPDRRFRVELQSVDEQAKGAGFGVFDQAESVRAICVPGAATYSRKQIDALTDLAKLHGAKGLAFTKVGKEGFGSGIAKFIGERFSVLTERMEASEGDLLLFVADTYQVACKALSAIRLQIGKDLELIDRSKYEFLWVNKFPLFEWNEDAKRFDAMHHLFTMPLAEDIGLLESEPGKVRGQLYDFVLNGVELLSGSIRINRPEIQQQVLDIVEMPREEARSKFGFLMDSFEYGAPPHGGSALGLDRLVAILCGEESIREVIAYPCNHQGVFPLDDSPQKLDELQLKELEIAPILSEKE